MVLLARRLRRADSVITLTTRSGNEKPTEPPLMGEIESRPSGPEGLRPAQFSVRGMLWFVTACGAYCTQFAALSQLDDQRLWRCEFAILAAWLVLGVFLLTKGVRGLIVAHCVGPALALFIKFLTCDTSGLVISGLSFTQVLAAGCFVSSLVSFPASIVAHGLRCNCATLQARPAP